MASLGGYELTIEKHFEIDWPLIQAMPNQICVVLLGHPVYKQKLVISCKDGIKDSCLD